MTRGTCSSHSRHVDIINTSGGEPDKTNLYKVSDSGILARCGLRLVPVASSGIIYWVAYPLLGALKI